MHCCPPWYSAAFCACPTSRIGPPGVIATYSSSSSLFSSRKRPRTQSSNRRTSAAAISPLPSREIGQERADLVDLVQRVVDVRREPHATPAAIHLHAARAERSDRRL